jgi:large subunit ribosomal protein L10
LPLTKERKQDLVAEYGDMINRSKAIIFTEYRGLSNKEMTQVRRDVRDANGAYRVAKLSLLKLALEEIGYPVPEYLSGLPLAVGFCFDEIPAVAKALTGFAQESELLEIRGGLMGQKILTQKQIRALADLPPLDVVRSQLLGLFDAPAAHLIGVAQAGLAQLVGVFNAYASQGEGAPAE